MAEQQQKRKKKTIIKIKQKHLLFQYLRVFWHEQVIHSIPTTYSPITVRHIVPSLQ